MRLTLIMNKINYFYQLLCWCLPFLLPSLMFVLQSVSYQMISMEAVITGKNWINLNFRANSCLI
jgi:hypothetical protein